MSHTRALSFATLLSTVIVPLAHAGGDAGHGKALFGRCAACHSATTENKVGPGLAGLFGREAGTAPDFHYSKAMVGYAKRWDDQTLDSFLSAPAGTVPGTTMLVAVSSASERADIIAYLKTLDAH
jgi:cytochrome c